MIAWTEVGEGRALPRDGADEGHQVAGRQASGLPLDQAGAKGMAAALRQVEEGRTQGLRC